MLSLVHTFSFTVECPMWKICVQIGKHKWDLIVVHWKFIKSAYILHTVWVV